MHWAGESPLYLRRLPNSRNALRLGSSQGYLRTMAKITVGQYAAGVVGLSLIRHWYGDGQFNADRLAELRVVLDAGDRFPWSLELDPTERDLDRGYAEWSDEYDGPNPLIEVEERIVHPLLRSLAGAGAHTLDAACGTGRHAVFLDSVGCESVGVDRSPEMLAVARAKLPDCRFELATLERLPFADDDFDVAVVALAMCHLADPTTALLELARVVRPGGAVVVSDPHPSSAIVGGQGFYGGFVEGRPMRWVRNHYHSASTWLTAFGHAELAVEECIEASYSDEQIAALPASMLFPDATLAALSGLPSLWVWQLSVPVA